MFLPYVWKQAVSEMSVVSEDVRCVLCRSQSSQRQTAEAVGGDCR